MSKNEWDLNILEGLQKIELHMVALENMHDSWEIWESVSNDYHCAVLMMDIILTAQEWAKEYMDNFATRRFERLRGLGVPITPPPFTPD